MSNQALDRGGHWCNNTGMFSRNSVKENQALEAIVQRDNVTMVKVQICHILNESTMQGFDCAGANANNEENKVWHRP